MNHIDVIKRIGPLLIFILAVFQGPQKAWAERCAQHLRHMVIDQISELLPLAEGLNDQRVLWLFDHDQTLIQTALAASLPFQEVMEAEIGQLAMWEHQLLLHKQSDLIWLAENDTADVVEQLGQQNQHYTSMLTARGRLRLLGVTVGQVSALGLEFSPPPLGAKPIFEYYEPMGLILTGSRSKGDVLTEHLETLGLEFDHIVFVDNTSKELQRVKNALSQSKLNLTTVLYTRADNEIASQLMGDWQDRAREQWQRALGR